MLTNTTLPAATRRSGGGETLGFELLPSWKPPPCTYTTTGSSGFRPRPASTRSACPRGAYTFRYRQSSLSASLRMKLPPTITE